MMLCFLNMLLVVWCRVVYEVTVRDDRLELECECGQFEHIGMLCCHEVMDVLHLEEVPAKHIMKGWTKDARDILPTHLVHYQKDQSVNMSFTCRHSTLCMQAMDVVRLGGTSVEVFEHMSPGLKVLMVSRAPFAEKRDGLGFEDCLANLRLGKLPGNGGVAFLGNGATKSEDRWVPLGECGCTSRTSCSREVEECR